MLTADLRNHDFRFKFNINIQHILPIIFAFVLFVFFCCYDQSINKFDENGAVAEFLIGSAFIGSAIFAYIAYKRCTLNAETVVTLLIICGFALRLGYAIQYNYNLNQHDVESLNSSGHLSYIYGFAMGEGLPKTNDWQFCHPPLHHFIAGLSVKLSHSLGFTNIHAFENIQFLTVFYSTMTVFAGASILRLCGVKEKMLCIGVGILAFHPSLFILAGSINNDILMILLSMYAVVFLLKWYKKHTVLNASICGLFCGLGMMTKVSAALIAVVAAVTVFVTFILEKNKSIGSFILQAVCFLAVFLPLGLWHPIRNYLLFEQPLGYVAPIPVTNPLYTGDYSIFERFFTLSSDIETGIYVNVWDEYNVWRYLFRNSLFGEYDFGNNGIAFWMTVANVVLIAVSTVAMWFLVFKRDSYTQNNTRMPLLVLYFAQLGFFIYFNIRYPFGCTMDFRYIVPLLFCGVAFIGSFLSTVPKEGIVYKIFYPTTLISTVVLSLGSVSLLLGV